MTVDIFVIFSDEYVGGQNIMCIFKSFVKSDDVLSKLSSVHKG